MCEFKIRRFIIRGTTTCAELANQLVYRSCWFSVTPLPGGYYEFSTKPEIDLKNMTVVEKEV